MSEDREHVSRKSRRRARRLRRSIFSFIGFLVMVYISALILGIFDGGLGATLRKYDIINVPASYLVEQFDIDTDFFTINKTSMQTIVIKISEDEIYFDDELITIDEIEGLVIKNENYKFEIVDDNAKRVTYSAVIDELARLGVVFEE